MPHKLLLADDSVTIQRVIELTFEDEDVQVQVVGDGRRAIERVQADRPDIVLADIGMPERDGYEVASFIKSDPTLSHIPVLLLTGAFEPIDEQRARSVGCDGVLVKPFEPQLVIDRVKALLASRPPGAGSTQVPGAPVAGTVARVAAPPATAERPAGQEDSIEDYFDRLDAAFANISTASTGRRPTLDRADPGGALEDRDPPPPPPAAAAENDPPTAWGSGLPGDRAPARHPELANAFAALLAAEQGYPDALDPAPAVIPEETIEEIASRVLARMGDESMRRMVSEIAERLVREEIDRIKRMSASGDLRGDA